MHGESWDVVDDDMCDATEYVLPLPGGGSGGGGGGGRDDAGGGGAGADGGADPPWHVIMSGWNCVAAVWYGYDPMCEMGLKVDEVSW